MSDLFEQFGDRLLAPISDDAPCGADLRYDPLYDQIKEARKQDDGLPKGHLEPLEVKQADWELVERLATEALATRSKDLQLVVWLGEAWMRRHGYDGLLATTMLLDGLCEQFWDGLYPRFDDDDTERRLGPLYAMVETERSPFFINALKQIPVTRPALDGVRHSLLDIEVARLNASRATVERAWNEPADPEPEVTMSQVLASAGTTPGEHFSSLLMTIGATLETLAHLEATIDARCAEAGGESISFRPLRDALEKVRTEVRGFGGTISGPDMAIDGAASGDESGGAGVVAGGPVAVGAMIDASSIRSREDAYRVLGIVQDYLQRIEPHSPAPYLIRRAIGWGRLSLTELLRELLAESSDLQSIYRLLGIRDESEE